MVFWSLKFALRAFSGRVVEILDHHKDQWTHVGTQIVKRVIPAPATDSIWTGLKAGETVHQADKLHATLFKYTTVYELPKKLRCAWSEKNNVLSGL